MPLQDKVSTEHRSLLLQGSASFPPPTNFRNGQVCTTPNNDNADIELDDAERKLMTLALNAYVKTPEKGFKILAPAIGQPNKQEWADYILRLTEAITNDQPLSDLDWARALFLTEMGFTSALVGFAPRFRGADEHGITILRTLQDTIRRNGTHY